MDDNIKYSGQELAEYIESGEYFKDAKNWYNLKYIDIFAEKSLMRFVTGATFICFVVILFSFVNLLPVVEKVRYSMAVSKSYNMSAKITRANEIKNDPFASVKAIMCKSYLIKRESYNYNLRQKQFEFIRNTSSKFVYRKFYSWMNIDNPESPILKYKKDVIVDVKVIDLKILDESNILIKFESTAQGINGTIKEKGLKEVRMTFDIDSVEASSDNGSKFDFIVTGYKVKEISSQKF